MKKTIAKRFAALMLTLCMAGACLPTAAATETSYDDPSTITPRMIGIQDGIVSIDVASSGRATCTGYVRIKSGYTADLSLYLQRSKKGDAWESIKEWTTSGSGDMLLDKIYYVSNGYMYRCATIVDVYDSNGNCVETITKFSGIEDLT